MNDNATIELTPAQMIEEYIDLRDQEKVAKDRYNEWLKENITNRMDELEMKLLDTLNKLGVDNVKAKSGTAYKTVSTSVTVADAREFRRHVIGLESWDLIDWRANKTSINDLVDKGEPIPPGINRTTFVTVNVRRS
jgi:hypothetical protein